ncbi:MAG: DUF2029 domain-containing protein [Gemmataceae bacterium]|nr:DUF2029 domain-containing protein [Gemmataceae bacterium]
MTEANPSVPRRWSEGRILLWFVLFALVIVIFGPPYLHAFRPPDGTVGDFHQEWLSARNFAEGGPVYADQRELARRFLGTPPERAAIMIPWNAHPPVAAMLALPFGRFPYAQAHLFWNLVNLPLLALAVVVIVRELRIPFAPPSVLPLGVVLVGWYALYSQIQHGQLNIVIMALVAAAFLLEQRSRSVGTGLAIGAAAAIKLFPAFLFLYFVSTRNIRAIVAGGAAFLALNVVALAVLGPTEFDTYLREVVPSVANYQSSRQNVSLAGFWLRIFDPHPNERVVALIASPLAANVLSYGTRLLVVLLCASAARCAQSKAERERAFALAVLGMLLVSPVAWPHYFLIAAVPLAWLWMNLVSRMARLAFWIAFAVVWLPNYYVPKLALGGPDAVREFLMGTSTVRPGQNLAIMSLPNYALAGLFLLAAFGRTSPAAEDSVPPRAEP